MIPFRAAHTYMVDIWEYPPPPPYSSPIWPDERKNIPLFITSRNYFGTLNFEIIYIYLFLLKTGPRLLDFWIFIGSLDTLWAISINHTSELCFSRRAKYPPLFTSTLRRIIVLKITYSCDKYGQWTRELNKFCSQRVCQRENVWTDYRFATAG